MRVLGIETSCDETAAAVVGGRGQGSAESHGQGFAMPTILSNIIHSQVSVHRPFGGVVPEVASREHVARIVDISQAAMQEACAQDAKLQDAMDAIDAVAVTRGPGLIGALLVGMSFAKSFALARGIPLIAVNHLEGHLSAALLDETPPSYPHIALVVSGGHTHMYKVERFGSYALLGGTLDDAAGEAFDKIAKVLGLGYPGGKAIQDMAQGGDPKRIPMPRGIPQKKRPDFSFSGLKTAAAEYVRKAGGQLEGQHLKDFCASVQASIVDSLTQKAIAQAQLHGMPGIVMAGGVAANGPLRQTLAERCKRCGLWSYAPPLRLCTDNAAMIAAAGYMRLMTGERASMDVPALSRWPLGELSG